MIDNRRIFAASWLLALSAVAFAACSSPAATSDETEGTAAEPASASPTPTGTIPSAEAAEYIGEKGTICGLVAHTRYETPKTTSGSAAPGGQETGGKGNVETSLDFDQPFPSQTFLVVVYPSDEKNFDRGPEELMEFYKGKEVCATGRIDNAFGMPFMRAFEQSQIEVVQ